AALGILGDSSQEISRLLPDIGPELSIEKIKNEKEFEKHLGDDSPAQELWNLLRRNDRRDRRWGIGPTTASKIMARKRPHLIPIEDSVVNQVTRSEEHTSELQSRFDLVCRRLLETRKTMR